MCDASAACVCVRPLSIARLRWYPDLRNLAVSNQRADSHKAPISRGKVRTQPQVAEQNVSCVLHDSRSDVTDLLFDSRGAFRLRDVVERKRRRQSGRKLIGPNRSGLINGTELSRRV